jgi:hypothetical protein
MRAPARSVRRAALLAALALVALSLPADARPPRKASVRHELEQLRAQLTELRMQLGQLQSAVAAERQRFGGDGTVAPGLPGGSVPGGTGLCADPCSEDSDGDGLGDCEDPCLCDPQQQDGDGDGTPDCLDPCPDDDTDACIDPCRWDSDADGENDCDDPCPWDPAPPTDSDDNGVIDCVDLCWLIMEPVAETRADGMMAPIAPWPCPILFRPEAPPPGS